MEGLIKKGYKLLVIFLMKILKVFFRLVGREFSEEKFEAFMQFVSFGIVGVSNTVLSYVVYTISLLLFEHYNIIESIDYLVAQLISFVIGVSWSFYWNNRVVFAEEKKTENLVTAYVKTVLSYSFTGLLLSSILLTLWINVFHISQFIAPLINLVVSVPLNFLLNKYWAFKCGN